MAKPGAKDEPGGMDKAELKKHLRFAKSEPITVAFAVDESGKAVVQMDKRKPGRALEKMLKDDVPGSKNHRFGTAVVDPEDQKTIRFTINKPGGGMARKLILALKGTGFNKVKIMLEDGSEIETHQGEDEPEEEEEEVKASPAPANGRGDAAAKEPAAGGAAGAAAGALAGAEAGAAAAAAEPAEAKQPRGPDAGALAHELTGLVKRMLAVVAKDGTQKAELTELATDAKENLKRGDLEKASAGIDIFREALGDVESQLAAGGAKAANGAAAPNGAAHPNGADTANGAAHPNGAAARNGAAPKEPAAPAANGRPAPAAEKDAKAGGAQPDLAKEGREILGALAHAVKQALPMAENIPGLGGIIKSVVTAVQGHVNDGDHQAARGQLKAFQEQIGGGFAGVAGAVSGSAGGQAAKGGQHEHAQHQAHAAKHAPVIDTAVKVWSATRKKIEDEVSGLHKAFETALQGHGMADDLIKGVRTKVESTIKHFDESLSHTLASINKAGGPEERAKHVDAAHAKIQHYIKHVGGDPTIKMIDSNPFAPTNIKKLVETTLTSLSKSIR